MSEVLFIIDELNGALLVEDNRLLDERARQFLADNLGAGQGTGCARPLVVLPPPFVSREDKAGSICVRIAGYYHNSLCEGPGRRSSVLFQSCPLKCKGCWVTDLHTEEAGELVPVTRLATELLNPRYQRDGVSILGGEPFDQSDSVAELVLRLKKLGFHIVVYTGNTIEKLTAKDDPSIAYTLSNIDMLIDGPFESSLVVDTGEYRGSSNQRLLQQK